jgi:16S rRNA (adenine1518-N6/adenine1519-N6)-dimethyltransferase
VQITRRAQLADESVNAKAFFSLVKMGFAKRRKMLRGALNGTVEPAHFEKAGIAPTARAEELTVQQWLALFHALHNITP